MKKRSQLAAVIRADFSGRPPELRGFYTELMLLPLAIVILGLVYLQSFSEELVEFWCFTLQTSEEAARQHFHKRLNGAIVGICLMLTCTALNRFYFSSFLMIGLLLGSGQVVDYWYRFTLDITQYDLITRQRIQYLFEIANFGIALRLMFIAAIFFACFRAWQHNLKMVSH